jgi:ribosomal protein L11 methyltransferase
MMSEAGWVKVSMEVEEERLEEACELLWEAGASGVEEQDRETFSELQAPVPEGRGRAVAWFGGESAEAVEARLREAASEWGLEVLLEAAPFTDESWKESWKQFFKPVQVSARLAVRPPWEEAAFGEGVEVLVIEPGMAFGTGTHATTRLCLSALDEALLSSGARSMLDVGCGSGILAIAAAKLDAGMSIQALDVDPEALRVSRENCAVNGVSERVEVLECLLDEVEVRAELVVANILAHILLRLQEDLIDRTAPGGQLLLSGLGLGDEARVRASFEEGGVRLVARTELEGWVALRFARD